MPEYQHHEAFCLMKYRSDDGPDAEEELIWNSRDGVTPFVVTLRSGKRASHVDWQDDQRLPDYQPAAGSRMFVDLTPERAREFAERTIATYADAGAPSLRDEQTRERAIEALAADYLQQQGAPDLVQVPASTTEEASRAAAN